MTLRSDRCNPREELDPPRAAESAAMLDRPRATVLTPTGRGAIGVVQVWGGGAVEAADKVFRPARGPGLTETPPGRLRLGRMGRGEGDEVVAAILEGDLPTVEIQCH